MILGDWGKAIATSVKATAHQMKSQPWKWLATTPLGPLQTTAYNYWDTGHAGNNRDVFYGQLGTFPFFAAAYLGGGGGLSGVGGGAGSSLGSILGGGGSTAAAGTGGGAEAGGLGSLGGLDATGFTDGTAIGGSTDGWGLGTAAGGSGASGLVSKLPSLLKGLGGSSGGGGSTTNSAAQSVTTAPPAPGVATQVQPYSESDLFDFLTGSGLANYKLRAHPLSVANTPGYAPGTFGARSNTVPASISALGGVVKGLGN